MYKDEHVSFAVFNTLVSSSIFIRAFINPSLFLVKDTAVASARYSLFLEIIKFKRLAKIGDNITIDKAIVGDSAIIRKNSTVGTGKEIVVIPAMKDIKANSNVIK
jgi:ADP-glucose pyrophosphorylase